VHGSVIGQLLFVLYINDIANLFNDCNCVCKLYADDLKLYSILKTDGGFTYLQDAHWYMIGQTNGSCNAMYVGNTSCNANLSLNVNMLPVVDRVKDLGVIIDFFLFIKQCILPIKNTMRAALMVDCKSGHSPLLTAIHKFNTT